MRDFFQRKWFEVITSVLSVIAIVISIWSYTETGNLAREANQTAKEGNQIAHAAYLEAQNANRVAQESNRINLLDKADPQTFSGTGVASLVTFGCKYPSSASYNIYSLADIYITFSNNAGRVASLDHIELVGTPYLWSVMVYDEQSRNIPLPTAIYPGTDTRFYFVARSTAYSDTEDGAALIYGERYPASRNTSSNLKWIFHFEDDRVITWETPFYPSSPGLDFSRNCEELDGVS